MRALFLFCLLLPTMVVAETIRCGTDDFGNTVCMDSNGVLTVTPPSSAGSSAGSVKDDGRLGHCGIDPFGNKVCR